MVFKLDLSHADQNTYLRFIGQLRRAVRSGQDVEGILVMRDPETVPRNGRFIEVELRNKHHKTIIIAVDVTNLYVVAYRTRTECWFLRDDAYPPNSQLCSTIFSDVRRHWRHVLRFGGKYVGAHQLETVAGSSRSEIDLGVEMLDEAVGLLKQGGGIEDSERARCFIIIIQMILEAVKFRYVEDLVADRMESDGDDEYDEFLPDHHMLTLENNWETLSEQIQKNGTLPRVIHIRDRQGHTYRRNASALVSDLAVIKFYDEDGNDENDDDEDNYS